MGPGRRGGGVLARSHWGTPVAQEPGTAKASEPPVMELRNVSKTFGEVRSLSGVDFKVNRAEIVGLLGDNGSGKSTLIKVVMGFHAPDPGGEIYYHGKRVDDWSVA